MVPNGIWWFALTSVTLWVHGFCDMVLSMNGLHGEARRAENVPPHAAMAFIGWNNSIMVLAMNIVAVFLSWIV
ncbi:hypothetical protein Deipe_1384 [Deinococcus peraridilitoris DSM 19664]|uniref:Uncharacterized protein n=2 Tax=Deinococcus TaxID=1298 RepID=L0A0E1_DEIPD|nr:hypothetical protein Deipe_1384 [Deinococcus peraridilitoris DSM 19664]